MRSQSHELQGQAEETARAGPSGACAQASSGLSAAKPGVRSSCALSFAQLWAAAGRYALIEMHASTRKKCEKRKKPSSSRRRRTTKAVTKAAKGLLFQDTDRRGRPTQATARLKRDETNRHTRGERGGRGKGGELAGSHSLTGRESPPLRRGRGCRAPCTWSGTRRGRHPSTSR